MSLFLLQKQEEALYTMKQLIYSSRLDFGLMCWDIEMTANPGLLNKISKATTFKACYCVCVHLTYDAEFKREDT